MKKALVISLLVASLLVDLFVFIIALIFEIKIDTKLYLISPLTALFYLTVIYIIDLIFNHYEHRK